MNKPAPQEEYDLRKPEDVALTRRLRAALIIAGSLLVLSVIIWFGAHPLAHAVKGWQSRRVAAQALGLIDEQKWAEAQGKVQDALALSPAEPAALKAAARFVTQTGNFREAVEFWKQFASARALTAGEHRDYALALLGIGNFTGAEEQLRQTWPNRAQGLPADWILGIQLALAQGRTEEAALLARRLIASKDALPFQQLSAARVLLSSNSTDGQAEAWSTIQTIARGEGTEALEALELLARQAAAATTSARAGGKEKPLVSIPELLLQLDKRSESNPGAGIIARELRIVEDPTRRAGLIQDAVEKAPHASLGEFLALCGWLSGKGEFAQVLQLLPLEKSTENRTLFLLRLDALAGLGRWTEVEETVNSQKFTLDPVSRELYLARCSEQLGEKTTAEGHWNAAIEAAGTNVRPLLQIGQYAEKAGALAWAEAAYRNVTRAAPQTRPAYEALLGIAQAERDARKIREILGAMLVQWPDDPAIQNDAAYLDLLLRQNLEAARQTAERLVKRDPGSLPHRATLALAELEAGHALAALDAFQGQTDLAPGALPRVRAVHAAVLAAVTFTEKAAREANGLRQEQLLPEEFALLAPILGKAK